jgi:peroxiredoxin
MFKTFFWGLFLAGMLASSQAGDNIGDFTLSDAVNGKSYTLSEQKDAKAVVIMFWSCECPNVQAYNERIPKIVEEYSAKEIVFWGINSNSTESKEEVKSHAQEKSYNFPMLIDPGNKVADMFGATRTPEIFVLDGQRNILYHGRIDNNKDENKVTSHDLTKALDEILAGKEVSVKETKSFGCTIKRKSD